MEIEQLKQKNDRMFVLVCLNFAMLAVLFVGSGYVLWQSATLVNKLKQDLSNAELAMAELKERFEQVDMDTAINKVMSKVAENIKESVSIALQNSDLGGQLQNLSVKVQTSQEKLVQTGEAITEINDKLQELDIEQLAQRVSYNILKGLGDGFTEAAETRKPAM